VVKKIFYSSFTHTYSLSASKVLFEVYHCFIEVLSINLGE